MINIAQLAIQHLAFDTLHRNTGLLRQMNNFGDDATFLDAPRENQTAQCTATSTQYLAHRIAPIEEFRCHDYSLSTQAHKGSIGANRPGWM
jgi:hypothetical protein